MEFGTSSTGKEKMYWPVSSRNDGIKGSRELNIATSILVELFLCALKISVVFL